MTDFRQPFGKFRIQSTREADQALIDEHIPQARANALQPNHFYFRAVVQQDGETIGKKVYHLDLERNIVEITESWHGAETAFDIIRLSARSN